MPDGFSTEWIYEIWSNLSERSEDESAGGKSWMWYRETRHPNNLIFVKYDVDVERAGTFGSFAGALIFFLDFQAGPK